MLKMPPLMFHLQSIYDHWERTRTNLWDLKYENKTSAIQTFFNINSINVCMKFRWKNLHIFCTCGFSCVVTKGPRPLNFREPPDETRHSFPFNTRPPQNIWLSNIKQRVCKHVLIATNLYTRGMLYYSERWSHVKRWTLRPSLHPENGGLPRCKNLWHLFFVFLARAGVWLLFNGLIALLFSLFYVIREFDKFLHRGWAENGGWAQRDSGLICQHPSPFIPCFNFMGSWTKTKQQFWQKTYWEKTKASKLNQFKCIALKSMTWNKDTLLSIVLDMSGSEARPVKADANGRKTICEFNFIAEK